MAEMKGKADEMHEHHMHTEGMPPRSALKPAEGASIKIIAPQEGQVFKWEEIPISYNWTKGKRGHHLHAYVDGELMGMFSHPKREILTGIEPGQHTLELRVVAEDHQTDTLPARIPALSRARRWPGFKRTSWNRCTRG